VWTIATSLQAKVGHGHKTSSGFEGTGIILGSIFVVIVLLFRHGIWGTVADLLHRRTDPRPNPGE
jgi:hypothetical protein